MNWPMMRAGTGTSAAGLSSTATAVQLAIIRRGGDPAHAARDLLADAAATSRPTASLVGRAILELQEHGWLESLQDVPPADGVDR